MSNGLVKVTAKCVGCGQTREIVADEIGEDEVPMCKACFSPMVAVSAKGS